MLGGLAPPHGGPPVVLRHTSALGVHRAEGVLRFGVRLVGGFAVPDKGLRVVLRHALAVLVHHPEVKRLEALQGDDVDSLLDGLNYEQGQAILTYLMALLKGVEEPSDERLRQTPMNRERYSAALASIPPGVPERLMAAFIARVRRQEASP